MYRLPRIEGSWHRTPYPGVALVHMTRIPNVERLPAEVVFAEPAIDEPTTEVVEASCVRQVEYAGVLAGAEHTDEARELVDFLLSEKGQALAASQGYIPARAGVALPAGYPERSAIKVLPFDAATAVANETANKEKFSEAMAQ